jgi:hypothetical protein
VISSKILTQVSILNAGLILAVGDIQAPMTAIFDGPGTLPSK